MFLGSLTLGALQRAASPRCSAFRELEAFSKIAYPEAWPFTPDYLARQDEESDAVFYDEPRFVTHIDDGAIGALRDYYAQEISPKSDVLDICSSWISHLPPDKPLGRVVGVGMNARELEANERLTEFVQEKKKKKQNPTLTPTLTLALALALALASPNPSPSPNPHPHPNPNQAPGFSHSPT